MPCPNSARKRSKTIAFRVSPEEYEQITNLAKLSGMDKRDFIMAKLMDHEIVVKPSTRVYKALKDTMAEIYQQLLRIRARGEISASMETTLQVLSTIFSGLEPPEEPAEIDIENQSVWDLKRE